MKTYMAWVGNNATYGIPHPQTGLCSVWGELYIFRTKKERDQFCDTWFNLFNSYPVPTNRKQAKANYFAGLSQFEYDNMIDSQEFSSVISDYNYEQDCIAQEVEHYNSL